MVGSAPHPFTLRQLQYALAVADTRSFRRAAERCAVSQPALSAQVARLEKSLGVVLFERARQPIVVTPAGEALFERMRRLVRDADDLPGAARAFSDPSTGTLRLGVIPTISPYLLPEVAATLRRRHPRLTVRWVEEKTPVLAAMLRTGALDGAVVALGPDLGEVETIPLATDSFVLAAARGHPLGKRAVPVRLADLEGQEVLLLDDGHCFRDQALALCSSQQAHEAGFRATSLPTLVEMTAGGTAVTLLPRIAVRTENRRGFLRIRPFASPSPSRTVVLALRPGTPSRSALLQLAATLREGWPGER